MRKIDAFMAQEVTRKEFLSTVGMGFLSVIGLASVVGWFTEPSMKTAGQGFGSGFFGR